MYDLGKGMGGRECIRAQHPEPHENSKDSKGYGKWLLGAYLHGGEGLHCELVSLLYQSFSLLHTRTQPL
jgi:hypothetical protein